MSSFTPGPWKAATTDDGTVVIKSADANIATMLYNDDEANSKLIAAAPELLEACKLALKGIEVLEEIAKGKGDAWTATVLTMEKLNAAIAQATSSLA